MRITLRNFAFVTTLLFVLPSASSAGVVNSPVPNLSGQPARVAYYVPGVTKNNGIETDFICTSLDYTAAIVGVEIFDGTGGGPLNDVGTGNGAQAVAAGGTVTIGTGSTAGFHEDEEIVGLPINVKGGAARIVSTSKRLACDALLVEETATPPSVIAPLKMITKRQNGD